MLNSVFWKSVAIVGLRFHNYLQNLDFKNVKYVKIKQLTKTQHRRKT